MEIQYRTVYPLILKEIEKRCVSDKDFCLSMIDGTNWLDGTNNIFKIRTFKNLSNETICYQSKFELNFIRFLIESKNSSGYLSIKLL